MGSKRLHAKLDRDGSKDASKDNSYYAENGHRVTSPDRLESEPRNKTLVWIERTLRGVRPDRGIARRIQTRLEEEWRANRKNTKFPLAIVILMIGMCLVALHSAFFVEE